MPTDRDGPASPDRSAAIARLAISLGLGVGFGWLLLRGGLPIVPRAEVLAKVRPWAVPGYLALLVVVHALRAVRWRHLLAATVALPLRPVLAAAWAGFAAVLLLPLRMGEVVRPYLISRRGAPSIWEAAGTVAAERIIDAVLVSGLLVAGLGLTTPRTPLPERVGGLRVPVAAVHPSACATFVGFSVCLVLLLLVYRGRAAGLRLVRRAVGVVSRKLAPRIGEIAERVVGGLGFLGSRRLALAFGLETVAYWAVNAASVWLLARGCGLERIGYLEASVVMGCIGIGILVPSGPGYFGTFQLSAYVALALYVSPAEIAGPGSAFVFVAYVGQLAVQGALGAVGLVLQGATGAAHAERALPVARPAAGGPDKLARDREQP